MTNLSRIEKSPSPVYEEIDQIQYGRQNEIELKTNYAYAKPHQTRAIPHHSTISGDNAFAGSTGADYLNIQRNTTFSQCKD